jgi:excisionase family DNA binding protein
MTRPLERHYTTAELAELLGLNEVTIRRAAMRGDLRSLRFGHRRRYAHAAVIEWLDALASPSPKRPAA